MSRSQQHVLLKSFQETLHCLLLCHLCLKLVLVTSPLGLGRSQRHDFDSVTTQKTKQILQCKICQSAKFCINARPINAYHSSRKQGKVVMVDLTMTVSSVQSIMCWMVVDQCCQNGRVECPSNIAKFLPLTFVFVTIWVASFTTAKFPFPIVVSIS